MAAGVTPTETETDAKRSPRGLSPDDLISNRALGATGADAFGYAPVAGRVAETLTAMDAPLTVGLFGPWGSGKSSMFELIKRELNRQPGNPRLVKYDASTYGGEALKRNFISHIAGELDYTREDEPDFHTGLYESRRTTSFDVGKLRETAKPALSLFLVAYVGFLTALCLLTGFTSLATKEDFLGEIARNLPKLIAPTAIAGLVIVVARVLVQGGTVDTDTAQPATDEEFSRRFRTLVERGVKDRKFDRLIVFVDELDRCSPKDVVATLTAIRTFLDEKHCMFVVAADRAALERALEEELPQPTPVDEEDPYYSSASSFFDKIFHDRVPLPALRGQRLYEYAYDQVKNRGGFWKELEAGEDGRLLRRVLYFLVPSHVRAPRRVNTLLNSFVRSASIADHRGFDWKERSRELAKLTVLETEFPALADDLRTEPRLLELVLKPPTAPAARLQRLLEKHGSAYMAKAAAARAKETENEPDEAPEADESSSDTVIAAATKQQRLAMTRSEREYLRRYLTRTRDIVIGRDLLFLEPAGAAIGMDDTELSDLLDRAIDEPDAVVGVLRERDVETQRLAARVLANMADHEFGEEAANAMTALLEVVSELGPDVEPIAHELSGSVRGVDDDEGLRNEQLVGGLSLALAARDTSLQQRFLGDAALFADADRTEHVASMLDRIPEPRRGAVYDAVGRFLDDDDVGPLTGSLSDLPVPDAVALFGTKVVQEAAEGFLSRADDGEPDRDGLVEAVYQAGDREGGDALRQRAQWFLLTRRRNLALVYEHAQSVLDSLPAGQVRDSHALQGLHYAEPEDWQFWASYLSDVDYVWSDQGQRAVTLIATHLRGFHTAGAEYRANFRRMAKAVAPFIGLASEQAQETLRSTLTTQLGATTWWSSDDALEGQEQLHEVARTLDADLETSLVEDLLRVPLKAQGVDSTVLRGLREMGTPLRARGADVVTAMEALGATGTEPYATEITLTRAVLTKSAKAAGAGVDAGGLQMDEMVAAAKAGGQAGRGAVVAWLELGPPAATVRRLILESGGSASSSVARGVSTWAGTRTAGERTQLVIALVEAGVDASSWIAPVAESDLDQEAVVSRIASATLEAGTAARREELVKSLVALQPTAPAAQRKVADLTIALLEKRTQVDRTIAVHTIPALGTRHGSAGRLREAFTKTADEHGHQLGKKSLEQLAQAGVRMPKKSATKKAIQAIEKNVKGFFR